jgi:hypothetical protein
MTLLIHECTVRCPPKMFLLALSPLSRTDLDAFEADASEECRNLFHAFWVLWQGDWNVAGAMCTVQASNTLAVVVDGEVFLAEWTSTTLSLFLDQFLGLSNRLSGCCYGWHLAPLVFSRGCQRGCRMTLMGLERGLQHLSGCR